MTKQNMVEFDSQGMLFGEASKFSDPLPCQNCPYYASSRGTTKGKSPSKSRERWMDHHQFYPAKHLIIAPAYVTGEMHGSPFLKSMNYHYKDFCIAPHILCGIHHPGEVIKEKAMKQCKKIFDSILHNYKHIIISGSKGMKQFIGAIGGDLKNHGRIIEYKGKKVLLELGGRLLNDSSEALEFMVRPKDLDQHRVVDVTWEEYHCDEQLWGDLPDILKEIRESKTVVIDIETNGLKDRLYGVLDRTEKNGWFEPIKKDPKITAIGIATDHRIIIFPDDHFEKRYRGRLLYDVILPELAKRELTGANPGFDFQWLNVVHNMDFPPTARDVLIEDFLRWQTTGHGGLKELTQRNFYYHDWEAEKSVKDWSKVPWPQLSLYLAHDLQGTMWNSKFHDDIYSTHPAALVYNSFITKAVITYSKMQRTGIRMKMADMAVINSEIDRLYLEIQSEAKICGSKKIRINPAANKDLIYVLFKCAGLQPLETTATGQPKLDKKALKFYGEINKIPFAMKVLEWRVLAKIKGTYLCVPAKKAGNFMLVHADYSMVRTASGRSASWNPNFQNLPSGASVVAKMVKQLVVPRYANGLILETDFMQAEMVVLYSIATEWSLINEFLQRYKDADYTPDVHKRAVNMMMKIPMEQIDKKLRQIGKIINFGLVYGMTKYGLSRLLEVELDEAVRLIAMYFEALPGIRNYMDNFREFVGKKGYVITPHGRCRIVHGARDPRSRLHGKAMNIAINTSIQVLASDAKVQALNNYQHEIETQNLPCAIINEVHDSIITDIFDPAYALDIIKIKEECFGKVWFPGQKVPMIADSKLGPSWGDATSVHPKRCWRCAKMHGNACMLGMPVMTKVEMEDVLNTRRRYEPCLGFTKIEEKDVV